MDQSEGIQKRPFLRRGTGLRRFYKDIDIDAHFQSSLSKPSTITTGYNEQNKYHGRNQYVEVEPLNHYSFSSVLKTADSPKRNLNVRFSKATEKWSGNRALDFGSDEESNGCQNKENWTPNSHSSGSSSDDESQVTDGQDPGEEEWETDTEDDESVVEINESIVDEVFKSILQEKAQLQYPTTLGGNHHPIFGHLTQQNIMKHKADLLDSEQNKNEANPKNLRTNPSNIAMMERELEMFEKMERMTSNQSFCSTASTVRRFVNTELRVSPLLETFPTPFPLAGQPQAPPLLPFSNTALPPLLPPSNTQLPFQAPPPQSAPLLPTAEVPFQPSLAPLLPNQHEIKPLSLLQPSRTAPAPPVTRNPAIQNRKSELEQDEEYLKALMMTRIRELESEISQHKFENKRMRDVSTKLETETKFLERSKKEFEVRQTKELEVIDELRRRLKKDQEKLNAELKTTRKVKSNEDETDAELKSLRLKVSELEKEVKVRSSRWASSARNFKTTIEELKSENQKLQNVINELRNDKLKLNQRLRRAGKIPLDITPPGDQSASAPLRVNQTGPAHLDSNKSASDALGVNESPILHANVAQPASLHLVDTADTVTARPISDQHTSPGSLNEHKEETDGTGVKRIFSADGNCVEVHYPNGDIKDLREINKSGVSKYYFKAADSWEIIHPDGTERLEFGTGEVQTKLPNGIREIKYVTGTVRRIYPDGMEECLFPDQTLIRTGSEGEKEIHLPNGQIEHHSQNLKMRIYPDGTEKVLYNDGSSLTKYSSGRQRFRNPEGHIVYDRMGSEIIG